LIFAALTALACTAGAAAEAPLQSESEAAIEFLLARVAGSELEFVRNGKTYPGSEAVKHMRRKYEYYADRIHSPEEFIELAGTKSVLSGKAYRIRDIDGELPAADWLRDVLAEYRNAKDYRSGRAE
jgi:Family of unknown function (DUF5329)